MLDTLELASGLTGYWASASVSSSSLPPSLPPRPRQHLALFVPIADASLDLLVGTAVWLFAPELLDLWRHPPEDRAFARLASCSFVVHELTVASNRSDGSICVLQRLAYRYEKPVLPLYSARS